MQSNSGMDPAELTLAVLRPDEAGTEPAEALDRLVGVCWHTYPMPGGRGWQFRYEPNVIKQIEERMSKIPLEDAKSVVLSEAQGYFSGPAFKLCAWPTGARQVPESAELQLVLAEDEKIAKLVCAYSDDSNPAAPIPRRFQNAIVAISPTAAAINAAIERAQRLLAAEAIEREHRSGDSGKLVREQLDRIKPELRRQFRLQTCRAFDRVVLAGGTSYPLEEQYQVPDEQMLQRPHGQACLRRFLDAKGLLYQAGDALDVPRFMRDVLPGTTPQSDGPDVYTTRAVHERFLGAPGLRLLPDGGVVRQTVLRAVGDGKLIVRLPDGRAFDAQGCVAGPEGKRQRVPSSLTTVALDDATLVTASGSTSGTGWIKEDTSGYDPGGGDGGRTVVLPRPEQGRMTVTRWEKVVELAAERPLIELHLRATDPASAKTLSSLGQPLGAESLSLSVTVGGALKDEGTINFAAYDVKPSHPTKPLSVAQTLFTAMAEGASFEVDLTLRFGASGRTGLQDQLRKLMEEAPESVTLQATFEKPVGASK